MTPVPDTALQAQRATLYEQLRTRLQSTGFDGSMSVGIDEDFPGGLRVTITGTATVCQVVPGLVVEQLCRPWGSGSQLGPAPIDITAQRRLLPDPPAPWYWMLNDDKRRWEIAHQDPSHGVRVAGWVTVEAVRDTRPDVLADQLRGIVDGLPRTWISESQP